jgi:hypothetical protein
MTRPIPICAGTEIGHDWFFFDVGGTRTSVSPVSLFVIKMLSDFFVVI